MPHSTSKIIVGLPGSGKSFLAKTFQGKVFDDPNELEEVLIEYVAGETVVITDCWLCLENNLNVAKSYFPNAEVIFFKNDPTQCKKNDIARGRKLLSQDLIDHLSKTYSPPEGALDVYRGVL